LNAGSYTWTGGSVTKSSYTKVRPANGVSKASVSMGYMDLASSTYVWVEGITINGGAVSSSSSGGTNASNVKIVDNAFGDGLCVNQPNNNDQNLLVDGNEFVNTDNDGCNEGRIDVNGRGVNRSGAPAGGIVLSNNLLQGGSPTGCTDGIQLSNGAYGVEVRGNEFSGIKQGSCSVHVDPLQMYGGRNSTIVGNYFHGNSTGIMSPDGNGSPMNVTDNVFVDDGEFPDEINVGGGSNDSFLRNTLAGGARIRLGSINSGVPLSSNETIRDNVLTGGLNLSESQGTSSFTISYNLSTSATARGTNGVNGSPTYAGGSTPTTYAGYALSSGSAGYHVGSDGQSMGIRP
jgi:hypothetical protein